MNTQYQVVSSNNIDNVDKSIKRVPRPVVYMIAFIIIVSMPPKGNRSCITDGPKHLLPELK